MTLSLPGPNIWSLRVGVVLALCGVLFLLVAANRPIRGIRVHVVLSGSMKPALPVGSVVITKERLPAAYQEGDIILFRAPIAGTPLVVHRLIRIHQDGPGSAYAETKGDANSNGDPWKLLPGQILGAKVGVVPWLGYLLFLPTRPLGFILVSGVLFAVLVFGELRYLWHLFQIH